MENEIAKRFLMINDQYFTWSPDSELCVAISKEDFSHLFDSQKDKLTVVPRVIKETSCPGCTRTDQEKKASAEVPGEFKSEDEYLSRIYAETDMKKRFQLKQIWDKQNGLL